MLGTCSNIPCEKTAMGKAVYHSKRSFNSLSEESWDQTSTKTSLFTASIWIRQLEHRREMARLSNKLVHHAA